MAGTKLIYQAEATFWLSGINGILDGNDRGESW
jgi:hypothetical protein